MDEELDGLRRELAARSRHLPGGAGFPVECRRLGVGPRRAGDAMAEALSGARRMPSAALMLGVAGAVEPGLETGRLLLADSYVLDAVGESPESIAPSAEMLAAAVAAAADVGMAAHRGASLTVDHLVCDGAERRRLRECYGAASVNMEDYAVAAAAHKGGGAVFVRPRGFGYGGAAAARLSAGAVQRARRGGDPGYGSAVADPDVVAA